MTVPRRTLRLDVAYDGTAFVGWQRQARGRSVQGVIEEALGAFLEPGAAPLPVMGASRTDAGVHATGQVASVRVPFETPAGAVHRALNIRLPADVRVMAVSDVDSAFHARFDARGKRYRYRIATAAVLSPLDRWFVCHWPYRADVDAMRAAAACLVGRHDFSSFQARGATTLDAVRTLTLVDVREAPGGEIEVVVEGTGFVRHQVRIMAGSLLEVGAGRRPVAWLTQALAAGRRDAAGPTAPAAGLVLEQVQY